ncbi:hypothetical protein [Bifidobacterium longum]|uniref:hypothetical protein n=1 Tax=Bifidobacterium longum TaxID=216816 RepID=UPI003D69D0C2
METLSLEAHCSESSVRRALKALEQRGTIRRGDQRLAQWDENRQWVPGVPVGRVGVLHGSSTRTRGRQTRATGQGRTRSQGTARRPESQKTGVSQ